MTAEQERNQAMDVAKGVAIICVLWVHFVQYYYVDDTVPVFEDYANEVYSFFCYAVIYDYEWIFFLLYNEEKKSKRNYY